jgi:hypothetical protein
MLLSLLLLLGFYARFARDWSPLLSYDTRMFYAQHLDVAMHPSAAKILVRPFFVPDHGGIDADEAKPVFVMALGLFAWIHHALAPAISQEREYSHFIICSCLLLFLSLAWFGARAGARGPGLVAALLVVATPWGTTVCFFSTYTALSMAVLYLGFGLLLGDRPWEAFAAGVALCLAEMMNQSTTVFIVGGLTALLLCHARGWRPALKTLALAGAGLAAPMVLLELAHLLSPAHVSSPLHVQLSYLGRSARERTEYFLAYDGDLFHAVLFEYSRVAALAMLLALGWHLGRGQSRPRLVSWLWLSAALGVAIIDLRRGPQFSRSYFVGFPLLALATATALAELGRGRLRLVVVVVTLALTAELAVASRHQYAAFNAFSRAMQALPGRLATFENDLYSRRLGDLVDSDRLVTFAEPCSAEVAEAGDIEWAVTGPPVASVIEDTGPQARAFGDFPPVGCRVGGVPLTFSLEKELPFFGDYPLLIYEDPEMTFRYRLAEGITPTAYLDGDATARIWRIHRGERHNVWSWAGSLFQNRDVFAPLPRLLVAACVFATGCQDVRFFDFDAASTPQSRLVDGWSYYEGSVDHVSYVWSVGNSATLAVPDSGDGDRLVRFRGWPADVEGKSEQRVTLYVNGTRAHGWRVPVDGMPPRTFETTVPRSAWHAGENRLRFDFAYADHTRGKGEERRLAFAFDWLEVVSLR